MVDFIEPDKTHIERGSLRRFPTQWQVSLEIVSDEELSFEEERDRLRLERQVERAFYQAGIALKELRDRRLYRSTHKTFKEYCQDRFGFTRSHPYRLIDAAIVIDNLVQMSPNGRQNNSESERLGGILPTNERQCRPLSKLEPEKQREVWQQAIELNGGKVPSGKIVSELVSRGSRGSEATSDHGPSQIKGKPNLKDKCQLRIGQQIRVKADHPLFARRFGIIKQIPNRSSAIVELNNGKTELISQEYLELELDSSIKELPPEGLAYTQGIGIEYNVRLSQETWEKLNKYAQLVGTATLDGAIARLLAAEFNK